MSPLPATPAWELAGPYGAERWVGELGSFEAVLLDDLPISLDPRDDELKFIRARGATCEHAGPWPYAFRFCPRCGNSLTAPLAEPPAETWSSPANAARGLPPPSCRGTPDPLRRSQLPMPGPSKLDFFVAGTPPRLLALDQTTGRLYSWKDTQSNTFEEQRWVELALLPDGWELPRWSWSAAASAEGVILPMSSGPIWLVPRAHGAQVFRPEAGLRIKRSAGGAASLADLTLVPVVAQDTLSIAAWDPSGTGWRLVHVEDADSIAAEQVFAAPSTNEIEAFWVGERGQLFARCEEGVLRCHYRAWRDGWQPMRAVRPVLSPNGVFHQIGRIEGRQSFEALIPPSSTAQRREHPRFVTSYGRVSFAGMGRYTEPWDERRIEYRDQADPTAFLIPLLAFDDDRVLAASCSPRSALRPFIETASGTGQPADGANTECRIVMAGSSIVPDDLRASLRARHVWDLVPFVYSETLFIYEVQGNRCIHWPLVSANR